MTENNRSSGSDPIADFQRWLMRSSAKNLSREVKGQFRRTFGGGSEKGDVWDVATTESPPNVGESPECAWCPVCRAARRFRDSGPGLASQVAGAGDALLSVAQDTLAAFEATLSTRAGSTSKSPAGTGWPDPPDTHRFTEPASGGPASPEPVPDPPQPVSGTPEPVPHTPEPVSAESTDHHPEPAEEGQETPDDPDHRP